VPGRDLDAGRLTTLLAGLPALTSMGWLRLRADLHRRPTATAARAFLAGAMRAIARCSGLQTLRLRITLRDGLADQLPETLVRELASVRSLEEVGLHIESSAAEWPDRPVTFSLAHVVAGLAGLPRLRALELMAYNVGMDATLPASMSCLAQLTSLRLSGFQGLRCAPGWARLPALACLSFEHCVFAGDGETALPGLAALAALTSFGLWECPNVWVLPASLWRLTQLRELFHWGDASELAGEPRGALPVAVVPTGGALCSASLTHFTLADLNLPAFPPGILAMRRLKHLDLSQSDFELLPEGVSVLTGLEELRLGRHSLVAMKVGGAFDARALGSLAGFPKLRGLEFSYCRVLFSSDFQAAAAHPRLERLLLWTSYPVLGPSCQAFVEFVITLLRQGRHDVLELDRAAVQGEGQVDSRKFRAALEAVGYPLSEADSLDPV